MSWRKVEIHGQPAPGDIYRSGAGYYKPVRAGIEYGDHIRWLPQDEVGFPDFNDIAPPPRPEPKFKVGDRVRCRGVVTSVVKEVFWSKTGITWRYYLEGIDHSLFEGQLTLVEHELPPGWRPMDELEDCHGEPVLILYDDGGVLYGTITLRQHDDTYGRVGWAPFMAPEVPEGWTW